MPFTFQKLRALRESQGLTTVEAAERVGLSDLQYRDYESNRATPDRAALIGLYVGLGLAADAAIEKSKEVCVAGMADFAGLIAGDDEDANFVIDEFDDYTLVDRSTGGMYYIPKDRLDSPAKLMAWIEHLREEKWVTARHLSELNSLCAERFGVNLHSPV
jgi:transcriptional regulator with XRE-family HTH domain